MGPGIVPLLKEALEKASDLEVRVRLEMLLEALSCLRQARAVMALEWMGTPEAAEVLRRLASGAPGHPITRAAEEALARRGSPRKP